METQSNFKVGDKIVIDQDFYDYDYYNKRGKWKKVEKYNPNAEPFQGTVIDIASKEIKVKLDHSDEVWIPSELLTLKSEVDKWMPALEAEYKQIEKQISEQLTAAAQLIKDANKLAQSAGEENLYEMGVYGKLYSALDEAGWSTSSFGC